MYTRNLYARSTAGGSGGVSRLRTTTEVPTPEDVTDLADYAGGDNDPTPVAGRQYVVTSTGEANTNFRTRDTSVLGDMVATQAVTLNAPGQLQRYSYQSVLYYVPSDRTPKSSPAINATKITFTTTAPDTTIELGGTTADVADFMSIFPLETFGAYYPPGIEPTALVSAASTVEVTWNGGDISDVEYGSRSAATRAALVSITDINGLSIQLAPTAGSLFDGCSALTEVSLRATGATNASNFVGSVTDFSNCFRNCTSLTTVDPRIFDAMTADDKDLTSMFEGATAFDGEVLNRIANGSSHPVSVTDMFKGVAAFTNGGNNTCTLSFANLGATPNLGEFFSASVPQALYEAFLTQLNSTAPNGGTITCTGCAATLGYAARENLINVKGWTINDSTPALPQEIATFTFVVASGGTTIRLPFRDDVDLHDAAIQDAYVEWDDGGAVTNYAGSSTGTPGAVALEHTYASPGTYNVVLRGTMVSTAEFGFSLASVALPAVSRTSLTAVVANGIRFRFTEESATSAVDGGVFRDCTSLTSYSGGGLIHSMAWAFRGCTSLTAIPSFAGMQSAVGALGEISFQGTFQGCTSLATGTFQPSTISSLNLIAVSETFRDCSSYNGAVILNTVLRLGIGGVNGMFRGCTAYNNAGGALSLGNVRGDVAATAESMFRDCAAFNQALQFTSAGGAYAGGKITTFTSMFEGATSFNDTLTLLLAGTPASGEVYDMTAMFAGATSFNQAVPWMTSLTTPGSGGHLAERMFDGATTYNQSTNGWQMNKCGTMANMFRGATAWNNGGVASFDGWYVDFTLVTGARRDFDDFAVGTALTNTVYSALLHGFFTNDVGDPTSYDTDVITMNFDAARVAVTGEGLAARLELEEGGAWAIGDGGFGTKASITVTATSGTTVVLPLVGSSANFAVMWADPPFIWEAYNGPYSDDGVSHTYAGAGSSRTINIVAGPSSVVTWSQDLCTSGSKDATQFTTVGNWGVKASTSTPLIRVTQGAFAGCTNLNMTGTLGVPLYAGGSLYDGAGWFFNCTSLTSVNNIDAWDVSNATPSTPFTETFAGCTSFNQNLNGFIGATAAAGNKGKALDLFNGASSFNNGGVDPTYVMGANVGGAVVLLNATNGFNRDISGCDFTAATSIILFTNGASAFNNGGVPMNITSMPASVDIYFANAAALAQPVTLNTTPLDVTFRFITAATTFPVYTGGTASSRSFQYEGCTNIDGDIFDSGGSAQPHDTSAATFMGSFLRNCSSFTNGGSSTWDLLDITSLTGTDGINLFLQGNSALSTAQYEALLTRLEAQAASIATGQAFHGGGNAATSTAHAAYASLVGTYGWTITDATP